MNASVTGRPRRRLAWREHLAQALRALEDGRTNELPLGLVEVEVHAVPEDVIAEASAEAIEAAYEAGSHEGYTDALDWQENER